MNEPPVDDGNNPALKLTFASSNEEGGDGLETEAKAQAVSEPKPRATTSWFISLFSNQAEMVAFERSNMSPSEPGWYEFLLARGARAGLVQADFLGRTSDAALLLRRSCVLMLLRALLKRHGIAATHVLLGDEDWSAAEQIPAVRGLRASLTPDENAELKKCLAIEAEAYFVGLEPKCRSRVARALWRAERQLIIPFEGDERRIIARGVRRWFALAALACVFGGLISAAWFGFDSLRHRHNLAYKRAVRASSVVASEAADASGLVDGDLSHVGFHTQEQPNPWVVIDLGAVQTFNRIVVYNRRDCCAERALPLVIEVSDDDAKYLRVAERQDLFERWEVRTPLAHARFVRLRLESTNMFHLNEVEIY